MQNAFPTDPFGRVSFISHMWQSYPPPPPPPPPGAALSRLVPNTNANSGRNSWNTSSIKVYEDQLVDQMQSLKSIRWQNCRQWV